MFLAWLKQKIRGSQFSAKWDPVFLACPGRSGYFLGRHKGVGAPQATPLCNPVLRRTKRIKATGWGLIRGTGCCRSCCPPHLLSYSSVTGLLHPHSRPGLISTLPAPATGTRRASAAAVCGEECSWATGSGGRPAFSLPGHPDWGCSRHPETASLRS